MKNYLYTVLAIIIGTILLLVLNQQKIDEIPGISQKIQASKQSFTEKIQENLNLKTTCSIDCHGTCCGVVTRGECNYGFRC